MNEKPNICLECGVPCNRNENFCSVDCLREFNKRKQASNRNKSKKKGLKVKLNINKRLKVSEPVKHETQPAKSNSLDFSINGLETEKPFERPKMQLAAFQITNPSSAKPGLNSANNSISKSTASFKLPSGDPTEWSCDQVYEFVSAVAGVQIAETFKAQDLDGMALSLIKDDHLVQTMQIKLGPALKIMSKFNDLRRNFAK